MKTSKPAAKLKWHKEARAFFRHLHSEYEFSEDEQAVVKAAAENLNLFWRATEQVDAEGLTVQSTNGMIRKHPATEISKNAWAAFLAGCRLLGVCQGDDKPGPGRPVGS